MLQCEIRCARGGIAHKLHQLLAMSPRNVVILILLPILILLLPSSVDGVGLAPGLYCGLETCYDVLGIERESFNKTELSRIFRKLARQFHPDRVKVDICEGEYR